MALLDIALGCIARGWHVFPCRPRTKEPAVQGGFKAATKDEERVRQWWARWPDANVGIATDASGLCVLDIDHGLVDEAHLYAWLRANGLPTTYIVRTGRTDGFGVQVYFEGEGLKSIAWVLPNGLSGDIRCATGYVMAAGSIHPSGEPYREIDPFPIAAVPPFVRDLKPVRTASTPDDGSPITEARNNALTSIAGKLRHAGLSAAALEAALLQVNEDRCEPPLSDGEVRRIAANVSKYEVPSNEAVTIGKAKPDSSEPTEPVDWRTRYATLDSFRNVQPPSFMIQDFLEDGSITALGAPVAQRKSIVVANVIHALLTGQPLFGHFQVLKRPERILYLCPEMGLIDVANRFKRLGLERYVGEKLFIRTMDDPKLPLTDLDDELPGALLILDTLTRFVTGNQNDAGDMAKFADINYAIKRRGATIMLLHHAIKGSSDRSMSLDSALRGSTELAAFVTCVWSTQLQDIDAPHTTPSNLKCVKQRGFASEPFQVSCDENFRMTMLGNMVEVKSQAQAASEAVLAAILKDSPTMGINKLQAAMKAAGHPRGGKWVTQAKAAISGGGAILT